MSMTPPRLPFLPCHRERQGESTEMAAWVIARLHRLRARGSAQRRPHWKVTVLLPSGLVTTLDVIGCEPYFRQ
jgi:hypothetical protein